MAICLSSEKRLNEATLSQQDLLLCQKLHVPLTYSGWNRLEEEIAIFKAITEGRDVEDG